MQLFQQSCGIKKDKRARFLAHNSKVSRCEEKLMKDVFLWLQIWPKEKGPDDKHQKMTWIHHPSSAFFKITHSPKKKNFVETTNPFCPKLEGRFGAVNRNQPPIGTDLRKMPVPCYHGPFWGGVFGMPVMVVTRGKVEEVQRTVLKMRRKYHEMATYFECKKRWIFMKWDMFEELECFPLFKNIL